MSTATFPITSSFTPLNISPIYIHSPTIIAIAFILALVSRFYPVYIQPYLLLYISTTSKQRAEFHSLYTEYCQIEDEAREIDGNTNLFAQHALLRRKSIKLQIQLEKFPKILSKQYPSRSKYTSSMYDEDGGNGTVFQQNTEQMFAKMPEINSVFLTQFASFFPLFILFIMYLIILLVWGRDYNVYSFHNFDHLFDKSPTASNDNNVHSSIVINGMYALSWIFNYLPGALVGTLQATTTSFFGLYYLFCRVLAMVM